MNLCFLFGKIESDIDFKFIIKDKNISIVLFNIKLENDSIVEVIGYDEIADLCYQQLCKNDSIFIYGRITESGKIEIIEFWKIYYF